MSSPQRRHGQHRRYSRSRSRSRERNRDYGSRRRNSRSRSRERYPPSHHRRYSDEKDLYHDIINDDYKDERSSSTRSYGVRPPRVNRDDEEKRDRERERHWRSNRDYEREYPRNEQKGHYAPYNNNKRHDTPEHADSDDSAEFHRPVSYEKKPSRTIIVLGLLPHITEADLMSALIQLKFSPTSIRLIRKPSTGASRGFAFIEFLTVEEATNWMELTKVSETENLLEKSENSEHIYVVGCHKLTIPQLLLVAVA